MFTSYADSTTGSSCNSADSISSLPMQMQVQVLVPSHAQISDVQNKAEKKLSSSSSEQISNIQVPHKNDVLCGRGNYVNYHPGNEYYRSLVKKYFLRYVACTKSEKPKFALLIYNEIRSRVPPGRFLKQNQDTKLWNDIGEKKAIDKTRQALREGAPEAIVKCQGQGTERNACNEIIFENQSIASRLPGAIIGESESKVLNSDVHDSSHDSSTENKIDQTSVSNPESSTLAANVPRGESIFGANKAENGVHIRQHQQSLKHHGCMPFEEYTKQFADATVDDEITDARDKNSLVQLAAASNNEHSQNSHKLQPVKKRARFHCNETSIKADKVESLDESTSGKINSNNNSSPPESVIGRSTVAAAAQVVENGNLKMNSNAAVYLDMLHNNAPAVGLAECAQTQLFSQHLSNDQAPNSGNTSAKSTATMEMAAATAAELDMEPAAALLSISDRLHGRDGNGNNANGSVSGIVGRMGDTGINMSSPSLNPSTNAASTNGRKRERGPNDLWETSFGLSTPYRISCETCLGTGVLPIPSPFSLTSLVGSNRSFGANFGMHMGNFGLNARDAVGDSIRQMGNAASPPNSSFRSNNVECANETKEQLCSFCDEKSVSNEPSSSSLWLEKIQEAERIWGIKSSHPSTYNFAQRIEAVEQRALEFKSRLENASKHTPQLGNDNGDDGALKNKTFAHDDLKTDTEKIDKDNKVWEEKIKEAEKKWGVNPSQDHNFAERIEMVERKALSCMGRLKVWI